MTGHINKRRFRRNHLHPSLAECPTSTYQEWTDPPPPPPPFGYCLFMSLILHTVDMEGSKCNVSSCGDKLSVVSQLFCKEMHNNKLLALLFPLKFMQFVCLRFIKIQKVLLTCQCRTLLLLLSTCWGPCPSRDSDMCHIISLYYLSFDIESSNLYVCLCSPKTGSSTELVGSTLVPTGTARNDKNQAWTKMVLHY